MHLNKENEIFPGVFLYEKVINNSGKLIKMALADEERWRSSRIGKGEGHVNKEIRSNRILDIPATYDNDIEWFKVSQKIWQYGDSYGRYFNQPFSGMEYLQMLHYKKGQEYYKPHVDAGPGTPRVFSALLYLNDVKVGGETHFNRYNFSVSPKKGRLLIFPANYMYLHEAKSPLSNDKFCIVTWFVLH